jgi:hypothetical protein
MAVPVLVGLGVGVTRLVAPKIAAMLFKKGLAKPLSMGKEGRPTGAAARVIEKVDDLPQPVKTKLNPPAPKRSKVPEQPSRSQAEIEMASLRSKKAYASRKGKTEKQLKNEAETKIRQADRAEAKAQRKRAMQESKNRRNAEVDRLRENERIRREAFQSKQKKLTSEEKAARWKGRKEQKGKIETHERVTESPATPRSQKRMRLARKGETTKRKSGGSVSRGRGMGAALRGGGMVTKG